jgi:DNA-binding NtrC family response regulator
LRHFGHRAGNLDTKRAGRGYLLTMANQCVILVVEDEFDVREIVVEVLTDNGLEIIAAQDADEALVAFKAHPEIRVLFTDVTMPGSLDGCDLASKVHELRPDVKVVLTSGKNLPEDCDIPEGGIFIPKPYSPDALARLFTHILN